MAGVLDGIRVDVVGSLLRPPELKQAFERLERGDGSEDEVQRIADDAIREVVRQQERRDLPVVTDGEFRRTGFQESMAHSIAGFTAPRTRRQQDYGTAAPLQKWQQNLEEEGQAITRRRPVAERLRLERNVPLEEWRFAQSVARRPAKITFIGPDRIAQRFAWEKSLDVYSGLDEFVTDLVAIQRQVVSALVEAGCQYVHVDEPGYTAYVDPHSLDQMRGRGEDPTANLDRSIRADNALVDGFDSVTFGVHLCRGNERSMWHREGTYDAIAERLFTGLKHQRLLLEYDDARSGGFEPLRFVPKGKVAVLGLITTKTPRVETVDDLRRRIDEAAQFLPLEQLALSPQCGFASGMEGNLLSEDDQWRKIEVMVETARLVWGDSGQ